MDGLSIETVQNLKTVGDPTHSFLSRYLDSVGDGSGTKNMGAAADEYMIIPPAGIIYLVETMRIGIYDAAAINASLYGGLAALATGCLVKIKRTVAGAATVDEEMFDLLDNLTITRNADYALYGELEMYNDPGISYVIAQIDFNEILGGPIRLEGNLGDYLSFEVQDDLTGINQHYVHVGGFTFTTG